MKATRLLKSLDEMIIHELLHPENASSFYLDAIRFNNEAIAEACEALLQQHIDAILATDTGTSFLLSLPYEQMHSLCSKSSLCVTDEKVLVTLFTKYLEHRAALPALPEEDPLLDWKVNGKDSKSAALIDKVLDDDEKAKRKEKMEKDKEEEEKKQADEKAAKEAELEKLDDLGKEHARWRAEVEGLHEASAGRLKLKRLSKAQKIELFKTIRFSFMKHEDLLALTMNPTFELAKQYIIEGLSVRLNPFENGIKDSIAINIEPRANYDPNVCRDAGAALHHGEKAGAAAGAAAGGKGQPGAPAANMKTGMTYNQYNNDLSQHNTPG
jgi:hypothetical protein